MNFSFCIKISLLFLVAFFLPTNNLNAEELKVDQAFWDKWESLIYLIDGEFQIKNSNFLLSHESPSAKKELTLYIQYLKKKNIICRYPARYNLLLEYHLVNKIDNKCPELIEYEKKAPINSFKYIYASESLTSITGMLGHGFLMGEYSNVLVEIHKCLSNTVLYRIAYYTIIYQYTLTVHVCSSRSRSRDWPA